MSRQKRTRLIINRPFQFKVLLIALAATGPIYLFFAYMNWLMVYSLVEQLHLLPEVGPDHVMEFIKETEGKMKIFIFAGSISLIVINAGFFIMLSHSIVGPIEKLKGHLIRKANNEPTEPFRIRSSDFFTDLPPLVNAAFKDVDPLAEEKVTSEKV